MNRLLPFLSKGEGKDHESIQSNTIHLSETPYQKVKKKTRKCYTQESQEVSHFPVGDHKAVRNRKVKMAYKHKTY